MSHYLYLLARDDLDQADVKIGVTGDLKKRMFDLQTGCSVRLFVLFAFMFGDRTLAMRAERALHKRLRPFRLKGEWYALPWQDLLRLSATHVATLLGVTAVADDSLLNQAGFYEALALASEIDTPSRSVHPLFIVRDFQARDC